MASDLSKDAMLRDPEVRRGKHLPSYDASGKELKRAGAGKGPEPRPLDVNAYRRGYDMIDWGKG